MELQVIWARKATGASVLFIMNRYVCLVVQALEMICQFADISCTVCREVTQSIVFSGLRVYGVNGRQWKTPLLVVVLGMVPATANLVCCEASTHAG
ncbi:hypothetical protein IEO21_09712 [Rhodonia placenta]|uniref:Uncharacterized protein n=1 Tax=Rhodonia placenta TaxID=104341 RepID=A0A8H7TY04_9APHY|nr:hypothetical protein IEO21_09712 [Postia placenta]